MLCLCSLYWAWDNLSSPGFWWTKLSEIAFLRILNSPVLDMLSESHISQRRRTLPCCQPFKGAEYISQHIPQCGFRMMLAIQQKQQLAMAKWPQGTPMGLGGSQRSGSQKPILPLNMGSNGQFKSLVAPKGRHLFRGGQNMLVLLFPHRPKALGSLPRLSGGLWMRGFQLPGLRGAGSCVRMSRMAVGQIFRWPEWPKSAPSSARTTWDKL